MEEVRRIAAAAINSCIDRHGCDWYEIKNRIKDDITRFLYFQDAIRALITENTDSAVNPSYHQEPTRIQTNVEDILDELILQSVSIIGKPVSLMTKEEKIEAIQFLNSSGAFLITRAGDKVSQYFGISKYTLYNYIKADQQ